MMTPAQMEDAYAALVTADGDRDAEALAKLGWQFYAELGEALARNEALRARVTAAALALRPVASGPGRGTPSQALCPGCGTTGAAEACAFCGQLQDPCCGHGIEHTPATSERSGRWQCAACRATVADDPVGSRVSA